MKEARAYPGLHRFTRRLPNGTVKNYAYAWKSGPALKAPYGTPEFAAEFRDALASRANPSDGVKNTLEFTIRAYLKSRGKKSKDRGGGFLDLAPRTQRDYRKLIDEIIRPEFGTMPFRAIESTRAKGVILDWRDKLVAKIGARQTDYAMTILGRLFSFGIERGHFQINPASNPGKVYSGTRAEIVWSDEDEARAMTALPDNLALALQLGIWTGQRPSDVLAMLWSDYEGEMIRIRQGKTKKKIAIPVAVPLKALLDAAPRVAATIIVGAKGKPLTKAGFDKMFRLRIRAAGIKDVAIGDTRGTTVTRMRRVGVSIPQICAITGHTSEDANKILEEHYAAKDPQLAITAIRMLEQRLKISQQVSQHPRAE